MVEVEKLIAVATDAGAASFRRRSAVADLARSEDPQVCAALGQLLGDPDPYLRRDVVAALGRLRDPGAVEPLLRALHDADDYVRGDAAAILGRIADRRAVASLQTLREDPVYSVRQAARRALEQLVRVAPAAVTAGDGFPSPDAPPRQAAVGNADATCEDRGPPPTLPRSEPPAASDRAPRADDLVVAAVADSGVGPADVGERWLAAGSLFTVAPDFCWENAVRMQVFFEQELPAVQLAYQHLRDRQQRLAELDQRYQQAFLDLGLECSDKDDDVGRCAEAIRAGREELARLERSASRSERELAMLAAEANSTLNRLWSLFWPQRAERTEHLRAELQTVLNEVRDKIDAARAELRAHEERHETLAAPGKRLRVRLESLVAARDAAAAEVHDANVHIDHRILDRLLGWGPEQRQTRVHRLADLSPDASLCRVILGPLERALAALQAARGDLQSAEEQLEQAERAAQAGVTALAEQLAAGFHVVSTPRQTPVRLQGSLRTSQKHSLWEGSSGADGWAAGSGTGQAAYQVDDIHWSAPDGLAERLRRFTELWRSAGAETSRRQWLSSDVEIWQRAVDEYIRYLRLEMERDFLSEGPAAP